MVFEKYQVKFECIVKVMVCVGLCLCCEVECWIGEGCVWVDGEVLIFFVVVVIVESNIVVDGCKLLMVEVMCFWWFYKLFGLVMINYDFEG